ncbi:MAG: hypothetical protein QGH77_05595 [Planctomycetota bacterium]|nr:hypothetical protein [Planctomycetota bacterium]
MAQSAAAKTTRLRSFLSKARRDLFEVGPPPAEWTVLERLMSLVIQGDAPLAQAEKAVFALQSCFLNWNEVRVAREFEVIDVLLSKRIVGAREKAPVVQKYLRRVFGMYNHLEIDWMMDATSERRVRFFDDLTMAPIQSSAVLDLDAREEGDPIPLCPDLKRFFARLGMVKPNPKESSVREIMDPLFEGDDIYASFTALRVIAALGCDPKHPKNKRALRLADAWADKGVKPNESFEGCMADLGLPTRSLKKASKAKKKVAKKKVAKKKTAKKTAKKATKKATKKA